MELNTTDLLIMRVSDAIARAKDTADTQGFGWLATNAPCRARAINGSAEDGQEGSEVGSHAHDICSRVDELCDGGITVVRKEAVVCLWDRTSADIPYTHV
jgi:hypothetical protein